MKISSAFSTVKCAIQKLLILIAFVSFYLSGAGQGIKISALPQYSGPATGLYVPGSRGATTYKYDLAPLYTKVDTVYHRSDSLFGKKYGQEFFIAKLSITGSGSNDPDSLGGRAAAEYALQSALEDSAAAIRGDFPAGATGSTNSNIGSGYRWVVPGTNNLKTFFAGNNITIDSVSNANGLTITAASTDTSHLSDRINSKVDSVTTNADSSKLYYWVNGVSTEFYDINNAVTGGDTTIYQTVLDSTGASGYKIPFAVNRKLQTSPSFLYDSIQKKLVIGNSNISIGGNAVKLYVAGNGVIGGRLGVNVNAPSNTLHVNGDVRISTIANGTGGTDSVLVVNGGVVKRIPANYYGTGTGSVTAGTINWPGTIYSTPTTGSVSSGTLTFAPSLATQSANTIFGNNTGSTATPTFNAASSYPDAILALSSNGFVKRTGSNTYSIDNTTYLSSYTETDPLALKITSNLSDLNNVSTARTNLGLGSFATLNNPATTNGDLIYFNGTSYTRLGIGTSKQTLHGGTVPGWFDTTAASGGGGSGNVFDSITTINVKWYNIKPSNSEATNTTNASTLLSAITLIGGSYVFYFPKDSIYHVRFNIPSQTIWTSLKFLGAVPPIEILGTLGTNTLPVTGSVIQSSDTTNGNAVIQAQGGLLDLWVQNLDIRTYDSTLISGVDAYNAVFLHMRDCFVNTGVYNVQAKAPARSNTFGVRTPQINQGSAIELYNVFTSGFYIGHELNEHSIDIYPNFGSCVRAISFKQSQHAITVIAPCLQRNNINFYFDPTVGPGGSTAKWDVTVTDARIEHVGAGQYTANTAWQQTRYDVLDSTNVGTGSITWHDVQGGSGRDSSFTLNGGVYLQTGTHGSLQYLTYPITVTTDKSQGFIVKQTSANGAATYAMTNSSGVISTIGKSGTSVSTYHTLAASDLAIYNQTSGNISILNDNASGNINLATGGVSTPQLTLNASGNVSITGIFGVGMTPTYALDVTNTGTSIARFKSSANHTQVVFDAPSGKNSNLEYANSAANKWYVGNIQSSGTSDRLGWSNSDANGNTEVMTLLQTGKLGIGIQPTATLHLKAGTTSANTAPLKFTAGIVLTTPESGSVETNASNDLFYSNSTTTASRGYVHVDRYTSTATGVTLDATYGTLEVTATGQTETLPTAVGITGKTYTIKLTASGSATVATTSSQTIDGSTTYSLSAQYKYVTVQSNGANWNIIANNGISWVFLTPFIFTICVKRKKYFNEFKQAA